MVAICAPGLPIPPPGISLGGISLGGIPLGGIPLGIISIGGNPLALLFTSALPGFLTPIPRLPGLHHGTHGKTILIVELTVQYVAIGWKPGIPIHIAPIAKILIPLGRRILCCRLTVADIVQRLVNDFRLIQRLISKILAQ